MNLCGTCKFWGSAGESKTFRECNRIVHDKFYYVDGLDELDSFQEEHKAVTQDDHGYYAALKCRADFGCVLHKEKQ
jgi:hypothetical protein